MSVFRELLLLSIKAILCSSGSIPAFLISWIFRSDENIVSGRPHVSQIPLINACRAVFPRGVPVIMMENLFGLLCRGVRQVMQKNSPGFKFCLRFFRFSFRKRIISSPENRKGLAFSSRAANPSLRHLWIVRICMRKTSASSLDIYVRRPLIRLGLYVRFFFAIFFL